MGRRPTSITEEYGEVDSRQTLWVKAPHVTEAAQHPLPIPALVNGSIPPWSLEFTTIDYLLFSDLYL